MEGKRNVKIVVLGDIGHSPRMANHAISLAESGHKVDILGYGESELPHQFKCTPNIYHHFLIPCPKIHLKLLNYIWKTIWTSINLLFLLAITRKADMVLVQNPPAIPSLFISWIYCKLIGAELLIDWHNYAHTIMALSVGKNSPLVSLTRIIEKAIGQRADYNFCVSRAMKNDLHDNWGISTQVVYDRPGAHFGSVSKEEMHDFFKILGKKPGFQIFNDKSDDNATLFSQHVPNTGIWLKKNRPAFVVSSTSWTEDEDFSILVNALQDYEDHWKNGNSKKLPNMLVAITGKGPLREYYLKDIESRGWDHVTVITPWLEDKDYPLFIGCANIGISLHTSSSGLDLPMKIVDLFGAHIPVLAYNFKALINLRNILSSSSLDLNHYGLLTGSNENEIMIYVCGAGRRQIISLLINELVRDRKNGYIFSTQQELSNLLLDIFGGFPLNETANKNLDEMKSELKSFGNWDKIWNNICRPIFDK